ncbi:unnamed protein product [Rotaria magnacalcarata]|uniref:Uncharacterized protein n=1 Tax=Rotaria magnacalcarata TaxID=392030 RepID=A0A817A6H3_9BILA|nr:unnamed protein product [Rotaria magnacalcarata]CAF2245768.1 unnamed protein product [Rotaria magnacalcarata]CAF4103602.1 unnamed protein product [Rotaria magnacalcarata]
MYQFLTCLNGAALTSFLILKLTLQNKLTIYDGANSSHRLASSISIERRNIQPKISLVIKKDTLSPAQILTLSDSTVQLPIINKLVSAAKLPSQPTTASSSSTATNSIQQNEKDNNNCDSVKRLKTTDELVAV